MNIREVLNNENIGKVYKCDYNNCEYKVISTGEYITMIDSLSDLFIFSTVPLSILVNTDFIQKNTI